MRIGQGIDIHAFGPGDHVMLAGVRIAHDRGLVAHSDGDVVIHAVCDALLGALALGDIGHHFPPSDARWKDVGSRHFLLHCAALMIDRGWSLANADVTLVCERPKIAPHVPAMRRNLAIDLGCPVGDVSVKATTSEGLGFAGRAEGIAAFAVVLLQRQRVGDGVAPASDPDVEDLVRRLDEPDETE
jgi:2-C-methyl-D-erythritol 2,4-cyclodiphosphate synthase